ncbi:MAG: YjbH domain-containing protein [Idiomarina sp.]|nr:YjbH domain-containing protein [Idiomarina sp.]
MHRSKSTSRTLNGLNVFTKVIRGCARVGIAGVGLLAAPVAVASVAPASVAAVAQSQTGVELQVNQALQLSWDEPVRLRRVIEQVAQQRDALDQVDSLHWHSARLVDQNGNEALHAEQQRIAQQLTELARYWREKNNSAHVALAENLATQVREWQLAYQPFRAIDFERSRQHIDANPLLYPGQYRLLVNNRPTQVPVYGASVTQFVALQPGQSVRGYLSTPEVRSHLLEGGARDQAAIVEVGGKRRQVPTGYYNASGDELMPGNLLWVPPASGFFASGFEHLADDVPGLLQHWVGDATWVEGSSATATSTADSRAHVDVEHWERQNLAPRRNYYGGTGLMQTHTARMAPEGETVLMYADTDEYRRYTVSMQVLPWLQASAFYTRFPNRLYSSRPEFSGSNILTDKGFDVKFRVWQESFWIPEIHVGLQDFAGTGLFDGEYIVASKRYGAFDFTAGIGFGRLGSRGQLSNPFCEISDEFCNRPRGFSGSGSQLEFDQYFRGPASFFGGVEYQTPWDPLRIMLEYDGNDYSQDRAGVPIDGSTPWNFGVSYQVADWLDTSVSYERGDTLMFNVVLRTNLNTLSQVRVDRPRVEPQQQSVDSVDDVNWNRLAHRVSDARTIAGPRFNMPDDDTVRVVGHPWRYRDQDEAIDRTSRILADSLPETVKTYEFETLSAYQPVVLTSVDADAFKRRVRNEDPGKGVDDTAELFERSSPAFDYEPQAWLYDYPRSRRIGYGLKPFFNQDFGGPEAFHFYQLGVKAFTSAWVAQDLHFFGEVGINLKNNYDRFNFKRDPFDLPLPRVRSDFRLHADNDVWLDSAQLTYFKRLSENVYGMAYGGYLERFFSGVGGEVLYREVDNAWAFGMNLNRVRQRDYEGWLGHESYETTTGHASVYYQMPWLKDSLLRLDFGRFLAGDDGVGITFARRFESGVSVTAYASFTNVSSEDYGEGSFTHGFSISVPFDLIGVRPTRQRIGMSWSPMSRDGGQPLWRRYDLYGVTDDRNPFWSR